ncbi:MAG: TadE/TadG family type IV pilus assembly protein [Thermomicrobiaceae bacterium]
MRLFNPQSRLRGQGIVEFALVLPIFLLLTLGTVELGWLVYSNHTLTNATREGARFAMVHGERSGDVANATTVNEVVVDRAGHLGGNIDSTLVSFSPDAEPGSEVTVQSTYDYQPLVGMMVGVDPMTLTSETTVIVQY